MTKVTYISSESVSKGHPDKICDQISDAILDELLRQDPHSRVAIECLTKNALIVVAGEVTTEGYVDVQKIARSVLKEIGYTDPSFGIDHEDAAVLVSLAAQSPDIAQGVDESEHHEQGAGDQGMMYGFACTETPELMPFPIVVAHKLIAALEQARAQNIIIGLGPDAKSQVSVRYADGKVDKITAVVISQQHTQEKDLAILREEIQEKIIVPVCGEYLDTDATLHINATGRFVIGGPEGDAGVTGRKIVVDTYGGVGRVGGGAFSGKDPSKVDRSGAYAARWVAKNIVAAGLADRCEVQISYSIGVARPTSINIDTFGTATVDETELTRVVTEVFDLTPRGIIRDLDLLKPIYAKTASGGHFGRDDVSWELTNRVIELKKALQ